MDRNTALKKRFNGLHLTAPKLITKYADAVYIECADAPIVVEIKGDNLNRLRLSLLSQTGTKSEHRID